MNLETLILPFLIALLAVFYIHPKLVKVAKLKNFVDQPNARKLQKKPVPILGGVAVFFGIFMSIACSASAHSSSLFVLFMAMLLMLYLGTIDDALDLKPSFRLIIQIGTMLALIYIGGYKIDNLHGLWGIYALPGAVAVALTVVSGVGIINSINLIDGVDGLSSGFGIMAGVFFGGMFFLFDNAPMTTFCATLVGALIPFFLHNVFGKESKMFIGDGGTLVLGVIMAVFVIYIIQHAQSIHCIAYDSYSMIAFTLAVLAVPVFDTLRVMGTRMLHRKSPFSPDKTHLHHLFIDLGISHAGTTLCILTLSVLNVLLWGVMGYFDISVNIQVSVIILSSVFIAFGIPYIISVLKKRNPEQYAKFVAYNIRTRPTRKGIFLRMQHLIDKI